MFLYFIPFFHKNLKLYIIRKTLQISMPSGTTLGPIGIVHLKMNTGDHK